MTVPVDTVRETSYSETMPRKKKHSSSRSKPWFVRVRGSYLPVSAAGWATYVPFVAYLLFSVLVSEHNIASKTLAILYIVPNWVAAAVIMTYFAARKS